jgi:hypothetical protein
MSLYCKLQTSIVLEQLYWMTSLLMNYDYDYDYEGWQTTKTRTVPGLTKPPTINTGPPYTLGDGGFIPWSSLIYTYTVQLGYNVMTRTEYFMSL